MNGHKYDIGIIGGGASGCAAAVKAAEKGLCVAVLEKNDSLMKKVIASGNGRCNISNLNCETSEQVLGFLTGLGIYTVCEEEGRLYPRTKYSRTVSERFEKVIDDLNIDVFTSCEAEKIEKADEGFRVTAGKESFLFRRLLIASGGKAGPQFGTAGDSFRFLRNLGHTVTTLRPSLTGIECEGDFRKLKGIRSHGKVELFKNGESQAGPETGEIQFTDYGLSGICIMNLSRFIILDRDVPMKEAYGRYELCIDFVPDIEADELEKMIENGDVRSFVRNELADVLSEGVKSPREAAERLKAYRIRVTGCRGWRDAQVTAGGAILEEIDMDTMESKLVPGLYVSGEALDYDGPCGGYNLNNAWMTGIRAGKAMAECIE